eukprot:scaffold2682_cov344-Pavlova_lutheri.AAC.14
MQFMLPTSAFFRAKMAQSHRSLARPQTTLCRMWEHLLRTGTARVNRPDCAQVQPMDEQAFPRLPRLPLPFPLSPQRPDGPLDRTHDVKRWGEPLKDM